MAANVLMILIYAAITAAIVIGANVYMFAA
jgi:hypothetical protein